MHYSKPDEGLGFLMQAQKPDFARTGTENVLAELLFGIEMAN